MDASNQGRLQPQSSPPSLVQVLVLVLVTGLNPPLPLAPSSLPLLSRPHNPVGSDRRLRNKADNARHPSNRVVKDLHLSSKADNDRHPSRRVGKNRHLSSKADKNRRPSNRAGKNRHLSRAASPATSSRLRPKQDRLCAQLAKRPADKLARGLCCDAGGEPSS